MVEKFVDKDAKNSNFNNQMELCKRSNESISMKNALFIAATGQNVGKTTLCLGILASLHRRFSNVGFIKPIGQQHVKISNDLNVDKDVVLFKEYFGLKSEYADMSPIILPSGFTRDFLDSKIRSQTIESSILKAFSKISQSHDFTIVEGTGHVGAGSIVHMNNAKVAKLLGLDMIIIAEGGLGSSYDELALNIAMCQSFGVNLRGVILNRVLEEKRAMIEDYFPKALKSWGIPLIGCIPYNAFLNTPTMKDFEILFKTQLFSGEKHHYCHFQHPRLVAGSLEAFLEETRPNELVITPASREDIVLGVVKKSQNTKKNRPLYGLIMTGRKAPSPFIIDQMNKADLPALYSPLCSYDAMKMITSFTAKIRVEDLSKIKQAIQLVEQNLNFPVLLNMD